MATKWLKKELIDLAVNVKTTTGGIAVVLVKAKLHSVFGLCRALPAAVSVSIDLCLLKTTVKLTTFRTHKSSHFVFKAFCD